jgi:hypothetical protein
MNVPVLLIHFNRPEMTRRQIEQLSEVRPREIYVLCDGPRPERPNEVKDVENVRRQLDGIPWDCRIHRRFQNENLGVYRNISEGISWFFNKVETGIILEDDCLPHPSFFPYCEELLGRYAADESVTSISGYTGLEVDLPIDASYCFTNYFSCWGWATWRRSWGQFDPGMTGFVDPLDWSRICRRLHRGLRQRLYWNLKFNEVLSGRTDSWAYRFLLSMWQAEGLAIAPKCNLVENAGFGKGATNTALLRERRTKYRGLELPLQHPEKPIATNQWLDRWIEDHCHSKSLAIRVDWLRRRLFSRLSPAKR